jgi:hypothetical protein
MFLGGGEELPLLANHGFLQPLKNEIHFTAIEKLIEAQR